MNWVFDWTTILLWVFLGKKTLQNKVVQYHFIFTFFIVILVSLAWNFQRLGWTSVFTGLFYGVRWLSYSLLLWPLIQLGKQINLSKLAKSFSVVFVSLCWLQYLFLPDMRWLYYFGWDDHYYRVIGPLLDPGFTGLILVFILVWLWENKTERLMQLFTLGALLLTYSRASFLALFVAMLWLKKPIKIFVVCLVLILALPRISGGEGVKLERTTSINARVTNWQSTWKTFLNSPFWGVGFGSVRSDSSLLYVLATTGVMGLIAYLGYLKSLFKLGPTFGAILVHSVFLHSLFYPAVLFWIALRLAIMESKKSELLL
jgi:hypothetical protein